MSKCQKMDGSEWYNEIKKEIIKSKFVFLTAFEQYYDEFKRVFSKLNTRYFASKSISIYDWANRIKEEPNNNN